jgi:hypothetical protein
VWNEQASASCWSRTACSAWTATGRTCRVCHACAANTASCSPSMTRTPHWWSAPGRTARVATLPKTLQPYTYEQCLACCFLLAMMYKRQAQAISISWAVLA